MAVMQLDGQEKHIPDKFSKWKRPCKFCERKRLLRSQPSVSSPLLQQLSDKMNTSYLNHTGYGPLPFWDDLANYTSFNNRDFIRPFPTDEERPLAPSLLGLATGAAFILTCGSKKAFFQLINIFFKQIFRVALAKIKKKYIPCKVDLRCTFIIENFQPFLLDF